MRVLHYIPNFSVTTETFIYDQVVGIKEQGVESVVLTSKRLNRESRPYQHVFLAPFMCIYNERITQSLALRFQLMPYLIDYKSWKDLLEDFKPDIVHCHTGNAVKTWMHVSEKLSLSIPTIASMHGSDVNSEPLIRNKYKKVLADAANKKNIHWTVPSLFLKQKLTLNLSVPADKISVVYNSINQRFVNFETDITFERLKVIHVGRFIPCKGHIYLINGFAEVLQRYPNASLTLVGSGPLRDELIEHTKALGISQSVNFIDSVNHKELPSLLAQHNIYVQPSVRDEVNQQEESFGVAALEAMAVGLAVIVSRCGGLEELVSLCDGGSTSLVRQKCAGDIAEAIDMHFTKKISTPSKYKEKIANVFSKTKNVNSVIDIYQSLLK